MYTNNCHFHLCFRTDLFVLAPLSETLERVGTIRPLGSRCPRSGRDPCHVSRVASLFNVFGLGHIEGKIPGFPQHPVSPIPVTLRTKVLMKSKNHVCTMRANKGYTFFMLYPCARTRPRGNIRSVLCHLINTAMSTANTQRAQRKKLPSSSTTSRRYHACVAHPPAPYCCG